MNRAEAVAAFMRARRVALDWAAVPLEAGMGGCPWRVGVCRIFTYQGGPAARGAVCNVLGRWHSPGLLAAADWRDVLAAAGGLRKGGCKARGAVRFSEDWLAGRWETVYELPRAGKTVTDAILKYCRGPAVA